MIHYKNKQSVIKKQHTTFYSILQSKEYSLTWRQNYLLLLIKFHSQLKNWENDSGYYTFCRRRQKLFIEIVKIDLKNKTLKRLKYYIIINSLKQGKYQYNHEKFNICKQGRIFSL
ncbi:unnamed protein product [Paramecium primaurelia]|uniref:Uncharacterized protein n=1 Tax=Paramecium primaurelia TaxID=5886 RepID=A0A8S1NVJ4_PARPR|nr:unnamed protein product [Paramecium primaurelia]